jgi:hypothetical protein
MFFFHKNLIVYVIIFIYYFRFVSQLSRQEGPSILGLEHLLQKRRFFII